MAVIEVRNLAKRYGEQVALDGVSFSVEQGGIFGILGPNGAGKTTAEGLGAFRGDPGRAGAHLGTGAGGEAGAQ